MAKPTNLKHKLFRVETWSQRDPIWGSSKMGSSGITLSQEGCLVTVTASLLKFLGIENINPGIYNKLLSENNGYVSNTNFMYWKMPDILFQGKVSRAEYQNFWSTGWERAVDEVLDDGRPVLAQVDFIPGGVMNQHWVQILGKINNDYFCHDPWWGNIFPLASKYNGIYRIVGYKRVRAQ